MRVLMVFSCSVSIFSTSVFADELIINCKKRTGGHAEVRTYQGGTHEIMKPTRAFRTIIDDQLYFIWGYATGGGDAGDYIEPGAIVQLLDDGQIRLKQESMKERVVPEGEYRFSMSRGYSITCNLKKRQS